MVAVPLGPWTMDCPEVAETRDPETLPPGTCPFSSKPPGPSIRLTDATMTVLKVESSETVVLGDMLTTGAVTTSDVETIAPAETVCPP